MMITDAFTAPMRENLPSSPNTAGRPVCLWAPCVMMRAIPRDKAMVPSVMMTEATRILVMKNALIAPMPVQATRVSAMARPYGIPRPRASAQPAPVCDWQNQADSTAPIPTIPPTDRS